MRLWFLVGLTLVFSSMGAFWQSGFGKPTPGTELVAEQVERKEVSGSIVFTYVLKANGYPVGERVGLMLEPAAVGKPDSEGRTMVGHFGGPMTVDEKGTLLRVNGAACTVAFHGLRPGETYYISIMSMGKKQLRSTTRVTPVPLEAKGGSCKVEAILTAATGDAYEIRGTGFQPKEQVGVTRKSGGKVNEDKVKAGDDGTWKLKVKLATKGQAVETVEMTFAGQTCEPPLIMP